MTEATNQTATFVGCVTINVRRIYEVYEQGEPMRVMDEAEFASWGSERDAKMRRLAAASSGVPGDQTYGQQRYCGIAGVG